MARYYVNKNAQANRDHEVHREGCTFMPAPKNRAFLGNFDSCRDAVRKAKGSYAQANGCYYCARPCNTG
jgi:hypothetical protein